jgi:hypothetical protein
MLTYGRAHLVGPEGGDPLLTPATWRKLHDAPVDDYAMGWNIRPFGFHHLGSAGTFTASLIVSPSRDIVVFAATNAAGWPNDSMLFSEVASRAFRDFARPADSL